MFTSDGREDERLSELPPIPGGWTTAPIVLAGRTFVVTRPARPDALLEAPTGRRGDPSNDAGPYWACLWPASFRMAEAILRWSAVRRQSWFPGRAIELGCGVGLVGLAALAAGLDVTLTDCDPRAVQLAVFNARRNGFGDARGVQLDWRLPATGKYEFVFGCDIIYDLEDHSPLLRLLGEILPENGLCWLGDPGRGHSQAFHDRACAEGFQVQIVGEFGELYDRPEVGRFQIHQLQLALAGKRC